MPEPYLLLVDLGGVFFQHDIHRAFTAWAAATGRDVADLARCWVIDPAFHAFERGDLAAPIYLQHLRELLQVDLDDAALTAGWNSVFGPADYDLVTLLAALDPAVFTAAGLSNTNPLHARQWRAQFQQELTVLSTVYCSHDIGASKPEPAIFAHVAAAEHRGYDRLILLDDQPVTVDAATALGLHARLYRGATDTGAYLAALRGPTDPETSWTS